MSTLKYEAADLIQTVRNRAVSNNAEAAGTTDQDILRVINEELQSKLFPELIRVKEEHAIFSERITVQGGQTRIPLSKRAGGNKIRNIIWMLSGTAFPSNSTRFRLPNISREISANYTQLVQGNPAGFYMEWNRIVLIPDSNVSPAGQLEVCYYQRPSELVLVAEVARIQSVSLQDITLTAAPPATFVIGAKVDVHGPDSGAECRLRDVTISNVVGNVVTITEPVDGTTFGTFAPAAGDYVCLAGECGLPMLPRELHPVLAQAAMVRLLEMWGDTNNHEMAQQSLTQLMTDALFLLDDRTEGSPQIIHNRHSFIPRSRITFRRIP